MKYTVTELVQLQADGRLVVLPCKVGDIVYFIKNISSTIQDRYNKVVGKNSSISLHGYYNSQSRKMGNSTRK